MVKEEVQKELLDYNGIGISVMGTYWDSTTCYSYQDFSKTCLCRREKIPDNYKVGFLQGGGTGQFAAVPLNLSRTANADYLVTGTWSSKAAQEAKKYINVRQVLPHASSYTSIPPQQQWNLSPEADYVYYCANETIHGVEFTQVPDVERPLVCDMSSNILTRPVDVSKFGVIYAGAQKNIGISGVSVVIVRDDLMDHVSPQCPSVLNYKLNISNQSLYNTPPTFSIYVLGKVLKWIKEQGGVEEMDRRCDVKSRLIYDVIDQSQGFYTSPVEPSARSRVNIPLRILRDNSDLEARFLKEAEKESMVSLKGH
ncbi:PSAT1, partial [Cordylochernes scorpioides]